MTDENRRANALLEIAAARDAIRVARAAIGLGILRDAMSRAYYAVFHALRALLLLEGLEAKTHGGVQRMLAIDLVRANKLDPSANTLYARLYAYRQASDYAYAFDLDAGEADAELTAAEAFVELAAQRVGRPASP